MVKLALRILPIYYLTIGGLWLVHLPVVREHLWSFLTFTFNYTIAQYDTNNSPLNHFWSLCVEEQYYLVWPLLVLGLRKHARVLLGFAFFFVCLGYVQFHFNTFASLSKYNFLGILSKMAPLSLGAIGAIWVHLGYQFHAFFNNKITEYASIVSIAIAVLISFEGVYLMMGFMSLYWVLKASHLEIRSPMLRSILTHRFVVQYGVISYGVYVFHLPIVYYLNIYPYKHYLLPILKPLFAWSPLLADKPWCITFPIYFVVYSAFAWASYHFFEKRILSLKSRLKP